MRKDSCWGREERTKCGHGDRNSCVGGGEESVPTAGARRHAPFPTQRRERVSTKDKTAKKERLRVEQKDGITPGKRSSGDLKRPVTGEGHSFLFLVERTAARPKGKRGGPEKKGATGNGSPSGSERKS